MSNCRNVFGVKIGIATLSNYFGKNQNGYQTQIADGSKTGYKIHRDINDAKTDLNSLTKSLKKLYISCKRFINKSKKILKESEND